MQAALSPAYTMNERGKVTVKVIRREIFSLLAVYYSKIHKFQLFSIEINLSRAVKAALPPAYTVKERGKVTVKGKGEMVTFWVESKANRVPPAKDEVNDFRTIIITKEEYCSFTSLNI